MARFARGFAAETLELCRATAEPDCPSALRHVESLTPEEASGVLVASVHSSSARIDSWLREAAVAPRPPEELVSPVMRLLEEETRAPEAPFSTILVVEVLARVPALPGDDLLARLLEGNASFQRALALRIAEALAGRGTVGAIRSLVGILEDPDTSLGRRALVGLASTRAGSEALRPWLSANADRLRPGLARDLPAALRGGDLLADEHLVEALLESDAADVAASTVEAMKFAHHELTPELAERVVALAAGEQGPDDAYAREGAIEALALGGDEGAAALERAVASSGRLGPREELIGLGVLGRRGTPQAALRAIEILREASSTAVVEFALTLILASPEHASAAVPEVQGWAGRTPGLAFELEEALATSNSPVLEQVGREAFPRWEMWRKAQPN